MAKWKQRWNWIIENSNKAIVGHKECSDMEIDPIELSEDAVKRRHLEFYDVGIPGQFSESQKMISEGFETKTTKRNKVDNDEDDELSLNKSDEIIDDVKSENDDSNKKATTVKFQSGFFNDPKNNKTQTFNKETSNEDDIKRTKSLKIHFKSSDEDEKSKDNENEEDKSEIISESDDMDADNDKIINDLEKTKNTWTRFQKTGIDKTLGTIDESSDSSWGFKSKNLKLTKSKQTENLDSENIWSDDSDDKKKKEKGKKDDSEYDSNYDNDIWSDDDDDDGDGGDDDGDGEDDEGDFD